MKRLSYIQDARCLQVNRSREVSSKLVCSADVLTDLFITLHISLSLMLFVSDASREETAGDKFHRK